MSDTVEQIKSRLEVADVISGYLKLQKSGINFKARCPFHNEKSPSFYVSPERQIWHCFGCAKGGDMFTFVQEIEGVEFPEAMRILARKAGVEIEKYSGPKTDNRAPLHEICEISAKFFEKQLWESPSGKRAMAYLTDRGLTSDTIKEFRMGYAPNDWQALSGFLRQRGFKERDIAAAGVVVEKEGRAYDRFRSRITFPIEDVNGQIVGFTARIFDPDNKIPAEQQGGKYINTPQTAVYDKSKILYGLSKGKMAVKEGDNCLLVEGNMDAIMSYQAGVKNVVATSGTALTPHQLRLLQRYTTNLSFCFDTDQAGALATRRGIGLALAQNFNIKAVELNDPECKDPADYVKKYGSEWVKAAANARPIIEFYFDKAKSQANPATVEGKKAVIASVAPLLKRLASHVERSHWVSQIASMIRATEDAVEADLATAKDDLATYEDPSASVPKAVPAPVVHSEADMLGETLLSIVLKNPALFKDELTGLDLSAADPALASALTKLSAKEGPFDLASFMQELRDEHQSYRFEFAYLKSQEMWNGFSDEDLTAEFRSLMRTIRRRAINAKLAGLEFDIKEAEVRHDNERIHALSEQFNSLAKQLSDIQTI